MYSGDKMSDPISFHFSFVVRCWRDSNGVLRGSVMDALTQRSYPFINGEEMTARIESLSQEPPQDSTHPPLPQGTSHA